MAEVRKGDAAFIFGAATLALTMFLLHNASTIYHALPRSCAKRIFNVLDHSAIYLLIAGTYTPLTLGVLRGALGWILFGLGPGFTRIGAKGKQPTKSIHIFPRLVLCNGMASGDCGQAFD